MTNEATVTKFDLTHAVHGAVPCVAIQPPSAAERLPICLFLYGGGGGPDNLIQLAPVLMDEWRAQRLAPMIIASAGVPGFCFYLDDPARGMHWESVVANDLVDALRGRCSAADVFGLVGVSMGGYGALKIALARSDTFGAVAVVAPMLEPSLHATGAPLRNRYHYPPDVPAALLGESRDSELYEADHPAGRALRNAAAIKAQELAIYLDAGSRDALHAHDGAEFLHRLLWDLDIRHEYHLWRDADHVGPTVLPRLLQAFAWVGQRLTANTGATTNRDEQALREMLAEVRQRAAAQDATFTRNYGVLRAREEHGPRGRKLQPR